MKYRLQKYEDGTYGYLDIDGDKETKYDHSNIPYNNGTKVIYYNSYYNGAKVICTQGENEDRDVFITKNGITFAKNQYGSDLKLDKQLNDENWEVREEVANQGFGLEKLLSDNSPDVRAAVADQGYGLDILVDDINDLVRYAVADQGYGFEKLMNDEDWQIRELVYDYLRDNLDSFDDDTLLNIFEKNVDRLIEDMDEFGWFNPKGTNMYGDGDTYVLFDFEHLEEDEISLLEEIKEAVKSKNVKNILNMPTGFLYNALIALVVHNREKERILFDMGCIENLLNYLGL